MSWKDRAQKVDEALQPKWKSRAQKVDPMTIQEMHPRFTTTDRLLIKNLANSPDAATKYLKGKYPDLDIQFDPQSGQYKAKGKDEADYRVLDPDTGIFSSDFLRDVGDIAFDIPAAVTEGAATTGGALLGGAFGGGIGALPGGIAAGGAMSASNEAIRQKLGQALGLPQEIDMGDVGVAGAVGAASPLLFGAGKARGALKTGFDWTKGTLAPRVGQTVSGVPANVLKNYSDDATRATVDTLEKEGVTGYVGDTFDKIKGYFTKQVDDAGEGLVKAIDDTGELVNVKPAKEAFSSKAAELVDDTMMTNSDAGKVEQLTGNLKRFFGRAQNQPVGPVPEYVDDALTAKKAFGIQKDLKQAAKFGTDMTPEDLYTKGAARDAYSSINEELMKASGGEVNRAKEIYKNAIQKEQSILPRFEGSDRLKSLEKTYQTLSNLDKNSKRILNEDLASMAKEGGLDLTNEADVLSAYKWLGDANFSLNPFSSGSTTSTSRTIPLAVSGGAIGGYATAKQDVTGLPAADYGLGFAGGALLGTLLGSPAAMKAYIRANRGMSKGVRSVMPSPQNTRAFNNAVWTEMLKQGYIPGDEPQE